MKVKSDALPCVWGLHIIANNRFNIKNLVLSWYLLTKLRSKLLLFPYRNFLKQRPFLKCAKNIKWERKTNYSAVRLTGRSLHFTSSWGDQFLLLEQDAVSWHENLTVGKEVFVFAKSRIADYHLHPGCAIFRHDFHLLNCCFFIQPTVNVKAY